ncbi:MAG: hypothetical protein LBE55_05780 [Clostridiales bacterium]|jgi:hypothetical protein|nr:hypothetical protein [Clostridiales bacterium]
MKRKILVGISSIMLLLMFSGCSTSNALLDDKINLDDIDAIQVVLAMGNPAYGADSKIITDRNEIDAFVRAFNSATIGDEVDPLNVGIGFHSSYYIYSGNSLVHQFRFNVNDTSVIWWNEGWHYIYYDGNTPFELFQISTAPVIVVDENRVEMERPQE